MRVAFLTHEPFHPPSGGGSAEAVYLVEEFVRRGHRVDLFCPSFPDHQAVARRFRVAIHPFAGWQMGRYTRARNPKYLLYPWFLIGHVRRSLHASGGGGFSGPGVDLWFAQHTISAVAAAQLRRREGGLLALNFLDYLTGFMESWPGWAMPRPVVGWLTRQELALPRRSRADAVLTVSVSLAERFAAAGVPPATIRPILYGYDAARFRPLPLEESPQQDEGSPPTVVMHGSFDKHHLSDLALEAVATVFAAQPAVRWRFIGKVTPTLQAFTDRVRARLPGVHIDLPGFVPYDQVGSMVAAADVGLAPYQATNGMHCAFVAKVVEYLGCGLPVASTRLENLSRHFASESAIRFSDFDGESLGRTVLSWLTVPKAERRSLGLEAAKRVAAELDWSQITANALDFVEAVVHGSTPRA